MNTILQKNYQKAVEHFHDFSTGDPTAVLSKEHGLIGLTRIITCMQKIGLDSMKVDFIALPDFTYTRNKLRWNAGFPYGCIVRFDTKTPFIPVDFRPNCCGVIFAELPNYNETAQSLQSKYYKIVHSYSDIDKSDFNRRNHFMGIYYSQKAERYYFLLHGSFNFAKKALYSEKNEVLAAGLKSETIMGEPFTYLIEDQAENYYKSYLEHEQRTMYYRELITKSLFSQAKIMFHQTHEGFWGINTILLGAYANYTPFTCPIMLAPECDLPIIQINRPVSVSKSTDVYCAPHGGGYALGGISAARTINTNLDGELVLTYPNHSEMLTNNILDMPFYYRTQTEKFWCDKYHFGTEVDRLQPILNLKV